MSAWRPVMEETLTVGTPIIFSRDSPNGRFSAFFEDEGDTGYFYAVDLSRPEDTIVDAVHIYDVANVVDRDRPSRLCIVWSGDGTKCALLINDFPHAAFDFSAKRGFCRTNFPNFEKSGVGWRSTDHAWADDAVSWLRKEPPSG